MKQFYKQPLISSIHYVCIAYILERVRVVYTVFNDNNKANYFPMKKSNQKLV